MWTCFSSLSPEPGKWLSREDELGQTLLPPSKFRKAHGGNFVVSFLVEVVDFITMWFYFHCTVAVVPPHPSLTVCALLSLHIELWVCLTGQLSVWACRGSRQTTPLHLPWEHLLFQPKLPLCQHWGFLVGGVIESMACSSTKRWLLTLGFKQAFKNTRCSDLSEHAELLTCTCLPGGSHSALWGELNTQLPFAVEAMNTEMLCSSQRNQCVFSLADSPADTVFVYSQRTHEEDFRDTHLCHWG